MHLPKMLQKCFIRAVGQTLMEGVLSVNATAQHSYGEHIMYRLFSSGHGGEKKRLK